MVCFGDDIFQLCASKPLLEFVGITVIFIALVGMTMCAATVRRS